MPTLKSPVLIGVDLWAQIGLTLRAPPRSLSHGHDPACDAVVPGLAVQTAQEQQRLNEFLTTELQKFEDTQGPTDRIQHHIRLKDDRPIKQRYRPRNPAMQAIINAEVEKMEPEGVIEPAHGAWSSPDSDS